MGGIVLAAVAGWAAYRSGGRWIAAVPLVITVVSLGVIVGTGRPLDLTPVPVAAVIALGALGGLWAHQREA